jgi:hypothetical protein
MHVTIYSIYGSYGHKGKHINTLYKNTSKTTHTKTSILKKRVKKGHLRDSPVNVPPAQNLGKPREFAARALVKTTSRSEVPVLERVKPRFFVEATIIVTL